MYAFNYIVVREVQSSLRILNGICPYDGNQEEFLKRKTHSPAPACFLPLPQPR